jgi:pimeloyl-ACP methyl ester carboxylesterase
MGCVRTVELELPGCASPGLLRLPDGAVHGGIVALHGAKLPEREQPLFTHLSGALTPLGYAVLSFDRRPTSDGGDTPLAVQAQDALTAAAALRGEIGAVVGLFGFSQGAWAAARAASLSGEIAFLAVLGCAGVSPAVQMRYLTDEALRRAGFTTADRGQAREVRIAIEDVLRGKADRAAASRLLDAAARRPWFELVYLPSHLPSPGARWHDMDYDPGETFRGVNCPTLVMYGEDEETVPVPESKNAWLTAARASGNADVRIVDLPGCGHFPAPSGSPDQVSGADISPAYTAALCNWFADLR